MMKNWNKKNRTKMKVWYSIDKYRINRSLTSGGPYTLLVDSVGDEIHTDSSLTNGQTYYYKIQAHN